MLTEVLLGAFLLTAAAPSPLVKVVADQPLPAGLSGAIDIRWADDRTVYLSLGKEGTVQATVEPLGGNVREIIPGNARTGGYWASFRLGASSRYLAAAAPFGNLTWLPLGKPQARKEFELDVVDLDVREDRLVVLGARRDKQGRWAPDGAIAWLGSFGQELRDLKPVLFDSRGAEAPNLAACLSFELGAVRFLADGSLLVLPGVQPGVHLYDASGRLLRTWDTGTLGIDTDCPSLTYEQSSRLQEPVARMAWLDQRRTVDDVLSLPQGPALVVKQVTGGETRWHLKILNRQGGHSTHPLPITYSGFRGTLRADVRGDRVAFLKIGYSKDGFHSDARLVLTRLNGS